MSFTALEAAELVGGKIYGNESLVINNIASIERAVSGNLTFLYLPVYQKYLTTTKASVVLIKTGFEKVNKDLTYIEVDNPEYALLTIKQKFFSVKLNSVGIHTTAFVAEGAIVGKNVSIGINSVVEAETTIGENAYIYHNCTILRNVKIGSGCLIYPNVTIYEGSVIGNNCIIHSGTVIGSDGFGYLPNKNGGYDKVPQIGNVIIGSDVEIGSNVSIDRAAIGSTIIEDGVKIDNLVQVAHNVLIKKNTVISSQSGISGSTKIGENCVIGGQVGMVGHIEITDNVMIGAQSGISKSITKSGKYFGSPAKELSQTLRLEAHIRNLPKSESRLSELENKLSEILNKLEK